MSRRRTVTSEYTYTAYRCKIWLVTVMFIAKMSTIEFEIPSTSSIHDQYGFHGVLWSKEEAEDPPEEDPDPEEERLLDSDDLL